ncbi:MAG: tetratricopeptide repeat-containing sulfotransferase family protein [Steroidobacteraceae bacterium]
MSLMNVPKTSPVSDADSPSPSTVEQEVRRIQELFRRRDFVTAAAAAAALLAAVPHNRDVLLLRACSLRDLGRIDESLEVLEQLEKLHPRFSHLYQERGRCHVLRRDAPRAVESFLRAVNLNPALPASWSMLERLYGMLGESDNAATAAQHVAILRELPAPVVQATDLFSNGDLAAAEALTRTYLQQHGAHVEAMRLLARIALAQDVLDEADTLLEAVLHREPGYRAARADYGAVLARRHRYREAHEQARVLLQIDPRNPDYRAIEATALVGLGAHAEAIAIYQALLGELTDSAARADVKLWLAHSLKTLGRQSDAIEAYQAAAAARADFGDAWWSLANLKTYRFSDAELAQMRTAQRAPATHPVDRYHLCFALGKALEDRGAYEESWQFYARGNALKRAESRCRPEFVEANTRLQKQVCTAEFFTARQDWGTPAPDPIFIVGLPRAGSTLLEQILASHSQVEGTQELAEIHRYTVELRGASANPEDPRYPAVLEELRCEDLVKLGERFLAETRIYRHTTRPLFIDKMPNNFRHIGLIHLMLPNAKIIDARREPMACCFGNLKQLFASGQEFAYSVEDIARYYRTYLELMEHWNGVLPGKILTVHHEDVIADLEGSVRRMLKFCGLPFEPACLEFHKTERSVRTASSEQVRRPISRDGLEQWRHFEPWLSPLKCQLADALTRYRETAST